MSLLVVGSVAYDSVETAFGKRDDALGGSATFFSLASALFTSPALVAVVGEDFKEEHIALLARHGVDLTGLERAAGPTFRWGGRYHEDMNGRDTLFTHLNVFETFQPKLSEDHARASIVFLANIHPTLQSGVLEQVAQPHFVAADTMNLWIDIAKSGLEQVLGRVDGLFINDEEAMQLTGARTVVQAAREIRALGPQLLVIKRGEHGALMFNDDDTFYVPAFPLENVVDPTGAGDTFAGGFMGHLAASGDFTPANMRRAAVIGSLMASFCVEGFSVEQLQQVQLHDVRRRYEAFRQLTAFDGVEI